MVTTQKVVGILKKAGFKVAEHGRAGFSVYSRDPSGTYRGAYVEHLRTWVAEERTYIGPDLMPKYAAAIRAAGFRVMAGEGWFAVKDGGDANV